MVDGQARGVGVLCGHVGGLGIARAKEPTAMSDHVRIRNLTIKHETEKAVLIDHEDVGEKWLPLSQVDRMTHSHVEGGDEIWIPKWLAEKHELPYDER